MRRIDADKLGEVKFHSLPYTHITPSDVEAESYKRGWNDAIDSIIEDAPTIEPEPQWIPCSEMEPKKSGRYLCTHNGTGIVSPDYYTTQEQAEELFADPEDEYLDLEEYIGWTSKNVIAWMPLPEPYKAERRTDDGSD